MQKISSEIQNQLLSYLDGELDSASIIKLENELEKSPLLKKQLQELHLIHSYLTETNKLNTPSKDFTFKVMETLSVQPIIVTPQLSPRKGLLLLIALIILTISGLVLLSAGIFDASSAPIIVNSSGLLKQIQLPTITFAMQGKWIINGLLILNIVAAFILLDKTVLKPYFKRRGLALHLGKQSI